MRTNHFGHLRDVRRLVVAMSRARLGLYIFGRAGLFANCFELQVGRKGGSNSAGRAVFMLPLPTKASCALMAPPCAPCAQPTFRQLLARPTKLALVPGERHGACARPADAVPPAMVVEGPEHMARVVVAMAKEWEQAAVAASQQWGYGVAGDADTAAVDGSEATPGEEAAPSGEQQQQQQQLLGGAAGAEQQQAADGQPAADKQPEANEQPGEQQVAVADGAKPMQD